MFGNLDIGQSFEKSWFWPNFRKSWFLSALRQTISILVTIYQYLDFGKKKKIENIDFGQNFRKISIMVKLFENNNFGQILEIAILRKIFKQSWFCLTF